MEEDIKNLLGYLKKHHQNLDKDIENAKDKRDWDNVQFYEGAKNATELFIHLMEDIIKKN